MGNFDALFIFTQLHQAFGNINCFLPLAGSLVDL
ncbi:Uncharacterised protein [Shigella sonnei]|nr:Uncharacterised protein [Shigella sonnei]